jgi:GrpB-like predicted nucleotidyltransferase (UPF0157 family)
MRRSGIRRIVQVVDYDLDWAEQFALLRNRLWPSVHDIALSVEHVGSTSVPGLAAKPIIDLDMVIPTRSELPLVISRLGAIGYVYQGNLGIEDREAFFSPDDEPPHNLYVCPRDSVGLRNHIALRDHLRGHEEDAIAYAALKRRLAMEFTHDVERYAEGKTDFILSILARYGFPPDRLDSIRCANQPATE